MQSWSLAALGLVAFALASLAAQSWRELLVLILLSVTLYVPVKWITAGTWFGADALTIQSDPWRASFSPTGAVILAIIFAAVVMILIRHVVLTLREPKSD